MEASVHRPGPLPDVEDRRVRSVDEVLPAPRMFALGLQHVLVMYAGAVAVPLIVGRALNLAPQQVAVLISADLFACGVATLIQSWGAPGIGIRLPVMMGVTFASVSPMLAMAASPNVGLLGIYGAVIVAGIFGTLVAPFISRLLPLFPPVVTGTIIAVIGVSLMRVGINWAGGSIPTLRRVVDGQTGEFPNPAYGDPTNLALAGFVLIVVLLLTRFGRGFISNVSVLLGIVIGCIVAALAGKMTFGKVAAAPVFELIYPFQFGTPTFDLVACITMCVVMIVVMIESVGMFLALGELTGTPVDERDLTRGLRADGVGTLVGGIFNTFPYTSFSQNVGLVGVTGVRSRWVTVVGGLIMLMLGFLPKLGALVESVPLPVLGGAGIVMFGMVAATGIRILAAVDYAGNRNNLFIVAISIGFGMIPLASSGLFFKKLPHQLEPLLDSSILLAAVAAVLLNLFFNGYRGRAEARAAAIAASHTAEA